VIKTDITDENTFYNSLFGIGNHILICSTQFAINRSNNSINRSNNPQSIVKETKLNNIFLENAVREVSEREREIFLMIIRN